MAAESVGGEEALSGTPPADLLPEAVLQQVGLAGAGAAAQYLRPANQQTDLLAVALQVGEGTHHA